MQNNIIENNVLKSFEKSNVIDGCANVDEGVVEIESSAFFNVPNIRKICIPKSLKHIQGRPFSFCNELEEIEVVEGNPYFHIDGGCLIETDYLKRNILVKAFASDTIPDDVVEVGVEAFKGSNVRELLIPKNVHYLNTNFATLCKELTTVKFEEGAEVRMIPYGAFEGCENLKQIDLPSELMGISEHAFEDCSSLEKVVLPSKVTTINRNAFKGCKNLTEFVVPFGVKHIGKDAFEGCDNLDTLDIEYEKGKFQKVNKEWIYSQFLAKDSTYADLDYEGCAAMRKAIRDIVKKAENRDFSIGSATILTGEMVKEVNASKKSRKNDIQK